MGKDKDKIPIRERPGFQKFVGGLKKIAPSLIGAVPFIGGAAGNMVESIIDQHASNKEEAMNAKLLFRQWELEELKLQLTDKDSARKREVGVAQATKDWLPVNIVPLLAIVLTVAILINFSLVLAGVFDVESRLSVIVLTTLSNYGAMYLQYYFGSSTGSKDKQKQIENIFKKE